MTISLPLRGVLPVLVLSVLAIVVCGFFGWQGLYSLHLRWIRLDEAYALGYPAAVLTMWWLYRHRQLFLRQPLAPAWSALPLFVGAVFGVAIGQLVQLQLAQQLGTIGMFWAGATAMLGWRAGRLLLFPLMLVTLAVPVWDFLIDPLRTMAVWFNQHMLSWLEIPALIDGYFIQLPSGSIEVADGCSGLNLLLAMTLVGLLFAESHRLPRERRVAIVLLAIAMGILDNWIRVFVLVLLAHYSEMQSELLHNHGSFGWWIFAASLLPYLWLASRIEMGAHDQKASAEALHGRTVNSRQWQRMALVVIVTTSFMGVAVSQLEHRRGRAIAGFSGPAGAISSMPSWLPEYRSHDVAQSWKMVVAGRDFELTALTFVEQGAEKKLIYYSNVIAREHALRNMGLVSVAPGFDVNAAVVNGGSAARAVWWYWWVDGAVSISPLKTKLLQLQAILFGDPSAALIAISTSTRCDRSDCAQLIEALTPTITPLLIESRRMPLVQ